MQEHILRPPEQMEEETLRARPKVWAKDLWHFISRILCNTICIFLCLEIEHSPLRFEYISA
ncbi:hypothetical protein CW705_05770 [Candidatus Bathyarchaeota archaeon]|nr:MAG: hypothetical protein CW705_05770 [Candidatus Bathyarchaeota archaeon]